MSNRIIALRSRNVKRLYAVSITPEGHIVEISGRNGQGKTSVLDSIAYALGGKELTPSEPIRRGAKKAEIHVDLGDLKVTRTFTSKGSYLTVTDAKGEVKSPQKILDSLVGRLSFDPLGFTRMKPADQVATLRDVAGLDFSDLERREKDLVADRQVTKRELANVEGALKHMEHYPDAKPVDVEALLAKRREIEGEHAKRAEEGRRIASMENGVALSVERLGKIDSRLEQLRAEVQRLEVERVDLAQGIETAKQAIVHSKAAYAAMPVPADPTAVDDEIRKAGETNRRVELNKTRANAMSKVETITEALDKIETEIEDVREERKTRLEGAKLPIEGLDFDETGVRYNGIPFDQCSAAEQLRVSVAMGLAMNPKLKVMLIRDGSLLDADSRRLLGELAESHDAQVWIETVAGDEPSGIVIEDGRVLGVNETPESEPEAEVEPEGDGAQRACEGNVDETAAADDGSMFTM